MDNQPTDSRSELRAPGRAREHVRGLLGELTVAFTASQ